MKLTGKQSRAARGLLKWNLHDLATRVRTPVKRIESFEKGVIHLQKYENEELIDIFKKHGIEFRGDFDVHLVKQERKVQGDGQNITLNTEDLMQPDAGDSPPLPEISRADEAAAALERKTK